MSKTCTRCGASFEATQPNQIYCSRSCNGKTVERTCEGCGKTFFASPYKVRQGKARFCSVACYKSCWVEPCHNCSKPVKRVPNHAAKFDKAFCSRTCYGDWKSKQVVINCQQCGKPITKKPSKLFDSNFCSKDCYNQHRAQQFVTFTCKQCGKEFSHPSGFINKSMYRGDFCSNECAGIYKRIPDSAMSYYDHKFTSKLRKEIRQRDNYTCQLCGKHQEDNDRLLDVHHIDYDKTNCHPSNLISLCHNCHSKTNYNRDYWLNLFITRPQ